MCGFSALIYLCREGALKLQIRGNCARNAFLAPTLFPRAKRNGNCLPGIRAAYGYKQRYASRALRESAQVRVTPLATPLPPDPPLLAYPVY